MIKRLFKIRHNIKDFALTYSAHITIAAVVLLVTIAYLHFGSFNRFVSFVGEKITGISMSDREDRKEALEDSSDIARDGGEEADETVMAQNPGDSSANIPQNNNANGDSNGQSSNTGQSMDANIEIYEGYYDYNNHHGDEEGTPGIPGYNPTEDDLYDE